MCIHILFGSGIVYHMLILYAIEHGFKCWDVLGEYMWDVGMWDHRCRIIREELRV